MNTDKAKAAIVAEVRNKRKYPKSTLGYLIGMMNPYSPAALYYDSYTRDKVLNEFVGLLDRKISVMLALKTFGDMAKNIN